MYICYTDGSCQTIGNEQVGGWASIICDESNNIVDILYQGFRGTTNNRMEIMAVLETLKRFKAATKLKIVSDSMYVVNTINEGWAKKWFEEKDYSKQNLDLWFQILELLEFHDVKIEWTKGHSDNKLNEEADKWAVFAARCLDLPKDEYYLKSKKDR